MRRRTILAPMRPRPIMPSCTVPVLRGRIASRLLVPPLCGGTRTSPLCGADRLHLTRCRAAEDGFPRRAGEPGQVLVSAEFAAHRLGYFPGKVLLVSRREPRVERLAQDGAGHPLVDGGLEGPAALAGIGDAMLGNGLVLDRQFVVFQECLGRQIQ